MSQKGDRVKQNPSKVEVVKASGRRKSYATVSFTSMMPGSYTPHQRSKLKEFESIYIENIKVYEKIKLK